MNGVRLYRLAASSLAIVLSLIVLSLIVLGHAAGADDGSWLDHQPPANWNAPGMDLPDAAPPEIPIDPRFTQRERAPETAEDDALSAAGWHLYTAYQAGWGIKVVNAASSYDGMGRPWGYQAFVFVDGALAGTLSPDLMNSRFDGALIRTQLFGPDNLVAEFVRYTSSDPLCCPSATSTVTYRVDMTDDGGVVVPVSASTTSTR
jgi:LppP/LprE lipoprotein